MLQTGYNGNENLKGRGIEVEYTKEMRDEYERCALDPIYFAENYIKIVTLDDGLITIKLFDFQKEIINSFNDNRYTIVNTSRQAGKTTTAVCLILHYILFNNYKTAAILANKEDGAKEVLERLKIAYEQLPKWLQQGVGEWNKKSVSLENGSKVYVAATSSSAIRGKSANFIYIDETAHVEGWESFYASTYPTISSGKTTKLLFTSTPLGMNHFHKFWINAKEGKNGFYWVEVPWNKVPGRDEAWKQDTLNGIDNDMIKWRQEFCCEFIGSSSSLISPDAINNIAFIDPIIETNEGLKIYEKPVKGHTYVNIVDVARGKGLDYSVMQIIDVTEMPYRQVAVFRDNMISPVDYAEVVHYVSKLYNNTHTLIEVNDIGEQISDILHFEYEMDNLLFTESAGRSGKKISGGYGKNVDKGIRTTKSVKSVGCSIIKMLVEQEQIRIFDHETVEEMSTFARKGTSYEAESGSHDDLMMGLVLFAWLSDQMYFKDITDINTMMKLKEKTQRDMEEQMIPFGFHQDDLEHTDELELAYF